MLERDRSISVHTRNLLTFATEMFKVSKNITPKISKDIFSLTPNTEYNLRHQSQFIILQMKTVYNGRVTVPFTSPSSISEIKEKQLLAAFKNAIKTWKPNKCPCGLCKKMYIFPEFVDCTKNILPQLDLFDL